MIVLSAFFMSCKPKDVKIPVNDNAGIHEIWNNSPIYILMEIKGNDTLADAKLGQTISTTKWLVAADKRLKLKQLLPALQKVIKKRHKKSMHSDGKGQLFFSYLDSLQKKVSFVEATHLELMPDFYRSQTYFKTYNQADKDFDKIHLWVYPHKMILNDSLVFNPDKSKKQILDRLKSIDKQNNSKKRLYLNFDKNISFNRFIDIYTFFKNNLLPHTELSPKIFIFTP